MPDLATPRYGWEESHEHFYPIGAFANQLGDCRTIGGPPILSKDGTTLRVEALIVGVCDVELRLVDDIPNMTRQVRSFTRNQERLFWEWQLA